MDEWLRDRSPIWHLQLTARYAGLIL